MSSPGMGSNRLDRDICGSEGRRRGVFGRSVNTLTIHLFRYDSYLPPFLPTLCPFFSPFHTYFSGIKFLPSSLLPNVLRSPSLRVKVGLNPTTPVPSLLVLGGVFYTVNSPELPIHPPHPHRSKVVFTPERWRVSCVPMGRSGEL